jgi:hypothetical protein
VGYEIVAPSEERQALFRSGVEVRQLDEVVEALCDAARGHRWFCVERRGQRYRWSFATTGGPYPLLRLACRFLGIPHYWVLLSIPPSRTGASRRWRTGNQPTPGRDRPRSVRAHDDGSGQDSWRAQLIRWVFRLPAARPQNSSASDDVH